MGLSLRAWKWMLPVKVGRLVAEQLAKFNLNFGMVMLKVEVAKLNPSFLVMILWWLRPPTRLRSTRPWFAGDL